MKTKIVELRQKRAKLIADARALIDAAEGERRDLTAEEQNSWDQMMADAESVRGQYDRLERQMAAEADLGEPTTRANRPEPGERAGGQPVEFRSRGMQAAQGGLPLRERREWRNLMRTTSPEYAAGFRSWLAGGELVNQEVRALQADLDTAGGYLMAPLQIVDALIKAIDDAVYIRQWATVFSVPNADSLGVPTLENDPADADWTTELAIIAATAKMSIGEL